MTFVSPSLYLMYLQEEGSLLGIQEFFTNIQRIKDGTKRNKEIASLQLELDKEEQEFRQYR
jgi:hypothetical protein